MKIDMAALRGLEREKEISFDLVVRRSRRRCSPRTATPRAPSRTPASSSTARPARSPCSRRSSTRTAASCASTTTPPRASAASPRAPPSRSSCSGCARPRASCPTASTPAARATSSPASCSRPRSARARRPTATSWSSSARGEDALEAVLPPAEQVPGEVYAHGSRLKCRVVSVGRGQRGATVTVSRTHPDLVRGLFALEVPEIADGSVEIAALAREAGHRTKIAVRSTVAGLERQGRLHRPGRLAGARRDDRAARREDRHRRLVATTRPGSSPARCRRRGSARSTVVDPVQRSARVVVPDYQLSLAIGKEGQNARLAARLTGWRIDIHSDAERPRRRRRRGERAGRRSRRRGGRDGPQAR